LGKARFRKPVPYIRSQVRTDDALLQQVLQRFQPLRARRLTDLHLPGTVCRQCYFIHQGSIQVYAVHKEGREATREILLEHEFVYVLKSFIEGAPAGEGLRTLEDAELLSISREDFAELNRTLPQFARIYQTSLERHYTASVERLTHLMALDSLDRVPWRYAHRPELLQRTTNRVVASYLNIDPATFSRLQHKM